jgi:lipopolysaccharide transport system permease protein
MSRTAQLRDEYFGHAHVTVLAPPRRFELLQLREIWVYRELLLTLAKRQIRVRYKQTVLGASWAVLQPVAQMLVFTVIFSRIAKLPSDGYPYPVFVYSGLLGWNYFATATGSAASSLVGNSHLITKVYFPRMIIPMAAVIAGLLDLAIASLVLIGLLLYYHVGITANLAAVPLLVVALMLAATGVGTALGALNVSFRDLGHALPFMMQVWLYATPIVYPKEIAPAGLQWLLNLNPMAGLTVAFRAAFLGRPFDLPGLLLALGISLLIFVVGTLYFHRVERRFADVV